VTWEKENRHLPERDDRTYPVPQFSGGDRSGDFSSAGRFRSGALEDLDDGQIAATNVSDQNGLAEQWTEIANASGAVCVEQFGQAARAVIAMEGERLLADPARLHRHLDLWWEQVDWPRDLTPAPATLMHRSQ
jgi:uncharacterized protein YggL (DUF469 family)